MKHKTLKERLEKQSIQKAVFNTLKAQENRKNRLSLRIRKILNEPYSYFVTFTLTDQHINKLQVTHYLKIKEALQHASVNDHIINNDYGDQTDRLHYHALICTPVQLDYTKIISIYKYGAVNFRQIVKKDPKSLKEYIMKLSNHAIKSSVAKIWRKKKPIYYNKYNEREHDHD